MSKKKKEKRKRNRTQTLTRGTTSKKLLNCIILQRKMYICDYNELMKTDETLMKSSFSFSRMCIGVQRTSLRKFLSQMQMFVQFTLPKTKEDIYSIA